MSDTERENGAPETVGETLRSVISESREADDSNTAKSADDAAIEAAPEWLKERDEWAKLPKAVRDEIRRRDDNISKGLGTLRSKHRDYDEAIAPYEGLLRQAGRSPAEEARRLFGWHTTLAGPGKQAALKVLAQNLGIDVRQYANGARREGGLPPEIRPVIDGMRERLETFERAQHDRRMKEAEGTVNGWAQNKPHFQKVRVLMGQLASVEAENLKAGRATTGGFLKADGSIDLDQLYEAAVHANPETRAAIQAEQRQKAQAARARPPATARRAPSGRSQANAPAPESLRETLRKALSEARSS